jgi:3',5'-cyclic AMP phosphodiesterase CpdA
MSQPLRFKNGKFKIMHVTDVQEAGGITKEAIALLEAALDKDKPDLVVFTGDQIAGYSPKLKGVGAEAAIRKTIQELLAPLEKRNVPFTITFGNHDHTTALSLEKQFEIYQESPCCVAETTPGVSGVGNHNLPIFASNGDKTVFSLYMLDSHGSAGPIGYAPLEPDQVDWYRRVRDERKAQNGGKAVPSLLFQHIPVPNVYDALQVVPKGKQSVRGFRARSKNNYVLKDEGVEEGSVFVETPCVPDTDTGLFAAAIEEHDILGMYFGHDHKNAFAGTVDGIRLGYSPGVCFTSYGPGLRRGCRIIELDESDLTTYTTWVYSVRDLLGEDFKLPFVTKLWDFSPSSAQDAIDRFALPLVIILLLIAAAIVLPIVLT